MRTTVVACLLGAWPALGGGLEVSPEGPVKTLEAARNAARQQAPGEARRIVVRAGAYFLDRPLVLTAADSGLTIEGAAGERVVVYGGRRVTGWQREGERLWSAALPEAAGKPWDFRALVVNGQLCPRARLPETGAFEHQTEFKPRFLGTVAGGWERKPTAEELTTFRYAEGDLGPWLDIRSAEIRVYHMWNESLVPVAALDPATRTVRLAAPCSHPPGGFGIRRYVVFNIREGLTRPGQWYLDRGARKVVYWPLEGEDMARAEAIAPLMESIVRLEGTQEAPVKDVVIAGLELAVTDTPSASGGYGALRFAGAVEAAFTERCEFRRLRVRTVAGQGIKVRDSRGARVTRCEVRETGAAGIVLKGEDSEIADNEVHHIGAIYPSAVALSCDGRNLRVLHNELHHTPYTALEAGGADHRIEGNLIHHAMLEMYDGAAFHSGLSKRLVLRGNMVRDIPVTGGYGSSAYYLDEHSEGCLVEGNVSVGTARPTHNHIGRGNTIRNNVFLYDGDMRLTFPKSTGYVFENNVLVARGKITFTNTAAVAISSGNVFHSGTGTVEGAPANVLLADPRLRNPAPGVYGFEEQSPAPGRGIRPVDVSGAGPRLCPECGTRVGP